jgi:hypothetical protein
MPNTLPIYMTIIARGPGAPLPRAGQSGMNLVAIGPSYQGPHFTFFPPAGFGLSLCHARVRRFPFNPRHLLPFVLLSLQLMMLTPSRSLVWKNRINMKEPHPPMAESTESPLCRSASSHRASGFCISFSVKLSDLVLSPIDSFFSPFSIHGIGVVNRLHHFHHFHHLQHLHSSP